MTLSKSDRSRNYAVFIALILPLSTLGAPPKPTPPVPIEQRCQELLLHAELQSDPKKISDTLFHTLAVDYPVLFDRDVNITLVRSIQKSFQILPNLSPYELLDSHHRYLANLSLRLRASLPEYKSQLRHLSKAHSEELYGIFTHVEPLKAFATFPDIPPSAFADIRMVMTLIHDDPILSESFCALVEEQILHLDHWLAIENRNGYRVDRTAAIKSLRRDGLREAVPTSLTGKLPRGPTLARTLNLKKLNETFEGKTWKGQPLTHDWLVHLDQDLWRGIQTFGSASSSRIDFFRESPVWETLYEKAGAWLLTPKPRAENKEDFLIALHGAEETLDTYARYVEGERYTLALAKASASERATYLEVHAGSLIPEESSALYPVMERTYAKTTEDLNKAAAEVSSLEISLEKNAAHLSDAHTLLKSLREMATKAPVSIEPSAIAFRSAATDLQAVLGIDPVLPKMLVKNKWGFW